MVSRGVPRNSQSLALGAEAMARCGEWLRPLEAIGILRRRAGAAANVSPAASISGDKQTMYIPIYLSTSVSITIEAIGILRRRAGAAVGASPAASISGDKMMIVYPRETPPHIRTARAQPPATDPYTYMHLYLYIYIYRVGSFCGEGQARQRVRFNPPAMVARVNPNP